MCYICLSEFYDCELQPGEERPPLLLQGCSCRGDKRCHVPCAVTWLEKVSLEDDKWVKCDTCKQRFNGPFMMGVAKIRYDKAKGDDVRSMARILATTSLARCHMKAGESLRALVMLNLMYADLSKEQSDKPLLVSILVDKAAALYQLGRSKEQTDTLYVIVNSGLPESDVKIMEANNQLSMALVRAPNPDLDTLEMAETCARKAVAASTLTRNEDRQIAYGNNLAAVLAKRGKFVDALKLLAGLLTTALRVFGADHEISVNVKSNIASFIVQGRKEERYDEAVSTMREAYDSRTRTLGSEHALTLASRRLLLSILRVTGAACARPGCDCVDSVLKARCEKCRVKYCTEKCREDDRARHASTSCVRKGARNPRK